MNLEKINNKKAIKVFVFCLFGLILLLSCKSKVSIEDKAIDFLISDIIDEHEYFNNCRLNLCKELKDYYYKDFFSLNPCVKGEELLNLRLEKLIITEKWDVPSKVSISNTVVVLGSGKNKIQGNVYKKVLNIDKEYIVKIECFKNGDDIIYTLNVLIFLNDEGNVIDWCTSPFVQIK